MLQYCLLIVACWFKKSLYYSPSIANLNKTYLIKQNSYVHFLVNAYVDCQKCVVLVQKQFCLNIVGYLQKLKSEKKHKSKGAKNTAVSKKDTRKC